MKLLASKSTFNKCRSRDILPIECEFCHETFYRTKNEIQWALKRTSVQCLKFCGMKCKNKSKEIKIRIKCDQCDKDIDIIPSRKKRFIHHFCSHSCGAKYSNSHRTGNQRSKLELWIEEQLTILYPKLEIHYNQTSTINSELDIFIPSMKLAFELNGIFHYEPIHGVDKLDRTKNNDLRKFQACSERGIGLCVIDTHNVKYLKKERDKKFLGIITKVMADSVGIEPTPDTMPEQFSKLS